MRRKVMIFGAALVILVVVTVLYGSQKQDPPLSAGETVYCIDPLHRGAVILAAASMGYLDPASTQTKLSKAATAYSSYDDWRTKNSREFADSCLAAIGAVQIERGQRSGSTSGLIPLLGVVVGAALTLVGSEWKSARDRVRARAEALRKSVVELETSANQYVRAWMGQAVGAPSAENAQRASAALSAQLRENLVRFSTQDGLDAQNGLATTDEQLRPELWPPAGADRTNHAGSVLSGLAVMCSSAYRYADQCERQPVIWRRIQSSTNNIRRKRN